MSRARAQGAAPAYSALDPKADMPVASVWVAARTGNGRFEELAEIAAAIRALECRKAVLLEQLRKDQAKAAPIPHGGPAAGEEVLKSVAFLLGIPVASVAGRSQTAVCAQARMMVVGILTDLGLFTETEIAQVVRRHRNSCASARRALGNLCDTDPKFRDRYNGVRVRAGLDPLP